MYTFDFTPNDTYINNILANPPGTTGNFYTISRGANTSYNGLDLFQYAFVPPAAGLTSVKPSAAGFSSVCDFGLGLSFNVNQLENFTTYASLFDNYRVNWIDLEVEYLANNASVNGSGMLPVIYAICDRDDALAPTDQHYLTGRQGYKTMRVGNGSRTKFTVRLRPKLAMPVGAGDIPIPHSPPLADNLVQTTANSWIDCQPSALISSQPPVYFGIKMWFANMSIPTTNASIQNAVRFTTTWNVSFKGSLAAF